tara:strand:- start:402 stop:905 length:504 start_codon:yes stop_codon:yes gene_type:complete
MKIGIISDTHNHLENSVFKYFKDCDEIWHIGDIGSIDLLEQLEKYKPTRAVWGNIDGHKLREAINEVEIFYCEGKKVLMIHIAGKPPKYNPHVRKLIYQHQPDILVCGHSHILRIEKDRRNNLLFINPGAAGIHGFHQVKTLVRFELKQGTISNMEVIELGKRGSLN